MIDATGAGNSNVVEVSVDGGDPTPIGSEKWASVGRVLWLPDASGLIMTAQPESSSIGTQVWFLPYPSGQARRLQLFKNIESRWDISGFTKKPDEAQLADD
jgi:hypothetical protein